MPTTPASEWITHVSDCLQERWKTIDPARLDDLAADLWRDEALRAMEPREAADEWLRPVNVGPLLRFDGTGQPVDATANRGILRPAPSLDASPP